MDKTKKFCPSKDDANKISNEYWKDLSENRENFLEELSEAIINHAKNGSYTVGRIILAKDKDYFKDKLEDAGYTVSFNQIPSDENRYIMDVCFK